MIDGRAGLWTELVNGQSLETLLASNAVLPTHEALEIGAAM